LHLFLANRDVLAPVRGIAVVYGTYYNGYRRLVCRHRGFSVCLTRLIKHLFGRITYITLRYRRILNEPSINGLIYFSYNVVVLYFDKMNE